MKYRTVIFLLTGWFASSGTIYGTTPPVATFPVAAEVSDRQAVVPSPDALLPPLTLLPPAAYLPRLREAIDPVRREQTRLRRQMQLRSLCSASEPHAAHREQERAAYRLRVASGNTPGNWSPYPDRVLDARTLSFPMRRKSSPSP